MKPTFVGPNTGDLFASVQHSLVPAKYPHTPGFKREGTSKIAAQEIRGEAKTLAGKTLAVIRARPSTADEVAAALNKSVLAIRPRLSELNALGKIVETSERRRNTSGKLAAVWRAA